ncbi:MAG: hypothetical protein WCE25_08015 [Nitrososphaeraceae archaeon]
MDSRDLADIFTSDNDLYYFEKQLARDPKRDNTRGDVLARYQSYRKYSESALKRCGYCLKMVQKSKLKTFALD